MPDNILLKPGKPASEEWDEMRKQPSVGSRTVHRIGFLQEAASIVCTHHEYFDRTGYPERLKADLIPLGARIFTVADVYDALASRRSYRLPMAHEKAAALIREGSGGHTRWWLMHFWSRTHGNLRRSGTDMQKNRT